MGCVVEVVVPDDPRVVMVVFMTSSERGNIHRGGEYLIPPALSIHSTGEMERNTKPVKGNRKSGKISVLKKL